LQCLKHDRTHKKLMICFWS